MDIQMMLHAFHRLLMLLVHPLHWSRTTLYLPTNVATLCLRCGQCNKLYVHTVVVRVGTASYEVAIEGRSPVIKDGVSAVISVHFGDS